MAPRGKVETPYRSRLLLHETADSAAPLATVSSLTRAVRPNPHLDAASSLLKLQEEDGPDMSYGSAGDTLVQGSARTDALDWNHSATGAWSSAGLRRTQGVAFKGDRQGVEMQRCACS